MVVSPEDPGKVAQGVASGGDNIFADNVPGHELKTNLPGRVSVPDLGDGLRVTGHQKIVLRSLRVHTEHAHTVPGHPNLKPGRQVPYWDLEMKGKVLRRDRSRQPYPSAKPPSVAGMAKKPVHSEDINRCRPVLRCLAKEPSKEIPRPCVAQIERHGVSPSGAHFVKRFEWVFALRVVLKIEHRLNQVGGQAEHVVAAQGRRAQQVLLIARQNDGVVDELPVRGGVPEHGAQVLRHSAVGITDERQRQAALAGERAEVANLCRQTYEIDVPPVQRFADRHVEVGIVDPVPAHGLQQRLPCPRAAVVMALPPLRRVNYECPDGRPAMPVCFKRPGQGAELACGAPIGVQRASIRKL